MAPMLQVAICRVQSGAIGSRQFGYPLALGKTKKAKRSSYTMPKSGSVNGGNGELMLTSQRIVLHTGMLDNQHYANPERFVR